MSRSMKNFEFKKSIGKLFPTGTQTFGFCDLTIVDSDGNEFEFRDLRVKVNSKGEHTLCAPARPWTDKDGNKRYRSAYRFSESLYSALVDVIFKTKQVLAAITEARASQQEVPLENVA